ncbi:enoyl-CoA hydratase/isomerase family protein [Microbulbifer spongiae]|uniref:Enoyl-CoA hydratase/isomerase family protein n=1 Tax=Microbulbifer spongiae TaxID=2944933 RepID=A0ABY9E7R2_9GAMM|nr:enoyl-CoA hydratase/isomerase family protein [Microbulbifer sp. MI-G]WKD49048.1 enoyl-CoA hydratase/isomerase family protein [Microbulbifer sp. MI-G]
MSNTLIESLQSDGVMYLTMNRPEVHNAFDEHQIDQLTAALQRINKNVHIKTVILGAEGNSFSAGGDLNYMRRMGNNSYKENLTDARRLANLMKTLSTISVPTIARVQGAAFGGGVGLISCCDFAFAASGAKFSLSEVRLGMVPATIAPYIIKAVGQKVASRLFMSGEVIDSDRAWQLGLISHLSDPKSLDLDIQAFTKSLLNNAPIAVKKAKHIVSEITQDSIDDEIIQKTISLIADLRESEEGKEGLNSFLEKRKPKWIS